MRPQYDQKALYRFRSSRTSQNLSLFHNLWPHLINLWHFCLSDQQCCPTDSEGLMPIHSLHLREAEKVEGRNNLFANDDRNRPRANCRNHPDLKEQEEHRKEVLPIPYRAEPRIDHVHPKQGQNLHPVNALNDMGALQRMIREMMEPEARRGERPTYRKPYPADINQIPLSPGFKVPNFTLFNGDDPHASSVKHIGRFSVQCIAIENNPLLKLRLFRNSLSGQAFTWYTCLPTNSIQTWEQMENIFHDYYYRIQPEVIISDLAALKQSEEELAQDFITWFRKLKMKCRIPMEERHFIQMAQAALKISLRKRFDGMLFGDLAELADKASK
ncbi:unnamed protein product [Prunus armeniaca]